VCVELCCASASKFIVYFEQPPVHENVGGHQSGQCGVKLDFILDVECTGRNRDFGNVENAFAARLGGLHHVFVGIPALYRQVQLDG